LKLGKFIPKHKKLRCVGKTPSNCIYIARAELCWANLVRKPLHSLCQIQHCPLWMNRRAIFKHFARSVTSKYGTW